MSQNTTDLLRLQREMVRIAYKIADDEFRALDREMLKEFLIRDIRRLQTRITQCLKD